MKNIILKTFSVIFMLAALMAVICVFAVTGGSTYDLDTIVRVIFILIALVFGGLAFLLWKLSERKNKKDS